MAVTAYQILVARNAADLAALVATAIGLGKKPTGALTVGVLPDGENVLFQAVAIDTDSTVSAYAIAQGRSVDELNTAVAAQIVASKLPAGTPVQGFSADGQARLYQVCVTGALAGSGGGGGSDVSSVAGRTGDVVLVKADVGLANVDNTTDAGKPVSTAQAAAIAVVAATVPPTARVLTTKTADWTLALADANPGALLRMNKATAVNVTVPPHTDVAFAAGAQSDIISVNDGIVTLVAGLGVTLNQTNLKLPGKGSGISLVQTAVQDTWDVIGTTTA